jgi:hypothetical protein
MRAGAVRWELTLLRLLTSRERAASGGKFTGR